jgi:hypothetical protein
MSACLCGCGQPARSPKGYASRACAFRFYNAQKARKAIVKRGPAPMCAYCHVCPVKWYRSRARWNTYCDQFCSASAIRGNLTEAQRVANAARLRGFTAARRAENPLVNRLLAETLQGRESVSAAEALEFGLKVYRQAWQQGHHAHGNQKRRAAREAA